MSPWKPKSHGADRRAANAKLVRKQYEAQPDRADDRRFYASAAWRKFRDAVLRIRPICECDQCTAKGLLLQALHLHHLKPRKTHPELQFDPANVQPLTHACHSRIEALIKGGVGR